AGIVGVELAQPGHVAPSAIAVLGADEELLRLAGTSGAITGEDLERFHGGVALARPGHARAHPPVEDEIRAIADGEQLAALVGSATGGLAQQRARLGRGAADAPAVKLARQPFVIQFGSVAAQGQAEAVLPDAL